VKESIPLPEFEQFYLQSGGKRRFSEYGILEGIVFTFEDRIRRSLAFFQYHIATDASFNLFQAIFLDGALPAGRRRYGNVFIGFSTKVCAVWECWGLVRETL
jgi:hypothetical protein